LKIRAVAGDVNQTETEALILNLFEGVHTPQGATRAVDEALEGAISTLIGKGEIKGRKNEITIIHTLGHIRPIRVIVAGLGNQESFNDDVVRQITANACRAARAMGAKKVATIAHGSGLGGMNPEKSGQSIAEGSLLGLYTFNKYVSQNENDEKKEIEELQVIEHSKDKIDALNQGIQRGQIIAEGVLLARDLVNEPANFMTPTRLAEAGQKVAKEQGLKYHELNRDQMKNLGMGALLGVSAGSTQPPKLFALEYAGDPDRHDEKLGLIGKGITFDSGGISIKPAAGMWEMKGDMSGAASVVGSMHVIARLKPRINVVGIVAASENMPGGTAQRPGDIVKAMNGKSIEITNTDAEGRLVLADAMCYAREKLGVTQMIDIATLTGAMVVALGSAYFGILGNNKRLIGKILRACAITGERGWQMPLHDDYKELLKSSWADMKNSGARSAGGITAALFLKEFTGAIPWAHLDIAGPFLSDKDNGYLVKGATGVPVRTLIQTILDQADFP
jgi:leucyl aminopeptidase